MNEKKAKTIRRTLRNTQYFLSPAAAHATEETTYTVDRNGSRVLGNCYRYWIKECKKAVKQNASN